MLNSDELQEMFIDTEANDHNQKILCLENQSFNNRKRKLLKVLTKKSLKIHFDTPIFLI